MAKETVEVFILDIRVPKQDARRVQVEGDLSLGSDSSCDIRITDYGLAPLQARFHLQNDVLTLTNLGPDHSLKVGSTKCGHGRMYILDKGDKCTVDKVKFIVRKEKVEKSAKKEVIEEEVDDSDESISSDDTQPGASDFDESTLKKTITEDGEAEYEIVEEVVYVDEDGNEVAKPKEPNFFSQFKDMVKKKENSKKKLQKPGAASNARNIKPKKIMLPTAGPLPRIFGLIYNIIFFFGFISFALPLIEETAKIKISDFTKKGFDLVSPYLVKIPAQLPKQVQDIPELVSAYSTIRTTILAEETFYYFTLFIAYEFLFHLLLGIGLGQFLVGLKNGGNPILTRLLAPIRVLLGILLYPLFFIFDLPVLFRKKSFKELITGSRYEVRSATFTVFLSIIIYPLLSLAAYNHPLILDAINNKDALQVIGTSVELKKVKEGKTDVPFNVKSRFLGINGKIFLPPKIVFIPGIESNKAQIDTKLMAFHNKKNWEVEIRRDEKFLEVNQITEIIKSDFLLNFTHPDLASSIKTASKKIFIPKDQLNEVLYTMLSLNTLNPIDPLMKFGVFLTPYFEGKTLIYQRVGSSRIESVSWVKSPTANFIQLNNGDTNGFKAMLFLNEDYISMVKVSHQKKHQSHGNLIAERLFYFNPSYQGTFKSLWNSQLEEKDFRSKCFLVADVFYNIVEKKEKLTSEQTKLIIDTFMEISEKSLAIENPDYQENLLENFEKMDSSLLSLVKRNKDEGLKELRLGLNRIQKALYKRDYKFFKANK